MRDILMLFGVVLGAIVLRGLVDAFQDWMRGGPGDDEG